jgi:hypothetical protein
MQLGAPLVNLCPRCTRIHRRKDELPMLCDEAQASGWMVGEVTLAEVKGGFKGLAVWIRGHVDHLRIVGADQVFCNDFRCDLFAAWLGAGLRGLHTCGLGSNQSERGGNSEWEW